MEIMTELTEDELEAVSGGAAYAAAISMSMAFGTDPFVESSATVSTTPSSAEASASALASGTSSAVAVTATFTSVS